MSDQADTLRRIMQNRLGVEDFSSFSPSSQVVTVASGKGGVGKSFLVANLGTVLARSGLRVLLVDADFGLANLEILFGVRAQVHLEEVLDQKASIQETVIGIEPNLWLLPSSSGLQETRSWDRDAKARLVEILEACPWEMDLILVDVGAGIQDNVISVHHPHYRSLVVMTPEPTSMTDAYGLIKILRQKAGIRHLGVIVNQVTDGRAASQAFGKLKNVASRFVDVDLEYLGHCVRDEKVLQSIMKRKILLDLEKEAPAMKCLELLAKRLKSSTDEPSSRVLVPTRFWKTLLGEVRA